MASSRHQLETEPQPSGSRSTLPATRAARLLAPEDIGRGDFVAVLDETHEIPSFWWSADAALLPPDVPVRMRLVPRDECRPLKVKSICLPYVLVKQPCGNQRTLDLRTCRLARLDRRFAKLAWRAYAKKLSQPAL
jgi:hypothetical protein